MILTFLIIFLMTCGGFALSYLFAAEETFLWRVSVGNVVGQVVFGLVCFVAACFFGFSAATISVSILIALAPLLLFFRKSERESFSTNWTAAKKNLEGADFDKFLRFAYYAAFLIFFYFFFERAMLVTKDGIFTGVSNNIGDLPFHLGTVFSFTDANNFPPQNPSFAGAKFTYPFIADLIAAAFVKIGASVSDAFLVQNIWLAFSLLVIAERFTFKLTGSRIAGKIAPALLFFNGGLGFLWFFKDALHADKGVWNFFWNIPTDYTIGFKFRWGNSLTTLFATQRSLLLGMPLTIVVLQKIWNLFSSENSPQVTDKNENDKQKLSALHFPFSVFIAGLLAGTLPLVHAHSLFVLFVVCAVLFFFRLDKWREWLTFAMGAGLIAVPELFWAFTGTATRAGEFIEWFFGWDKRDLNFFWFWIKNTGIFIPILIFGIYLVWKTGTRDEGREMKDESSKAKEPTEKDRKDKAKQTKSENHNNSDSEPKISSLVPRPSSLLVFYLPFVFLFIISNSLKLAPWEWDNIKVLIYWYVGSIPFAAFALAWMWKKDVFFKFIAAGCLIVLTLAGAIDVWRQTSRAINYGVFSADAVSIAGQIKQKTAPDAIFLNAPMYNTAAVLSGRLSIMRYGGHLASHGIDFNEREADIKRIFQGEGTAEILLKKYGVDYVLIGPEVTDYLRDNNLSLDANFFNKFPVVAEAGDYKVYKVK